MKVFVSWSGEPSKSIAKELAEWLPKVLQSVETWMSDEDLQKGNQWSAQLSEELADTTYGLICLTHSNQESPWINFEAGALSKKVTDKTRVTPVLIDLEPADVITPLKEFQAARLDKNDWRKTIAQMNQLTERPVDKFDEVFEVWWDLLEPKLHNILAHYRHPMNADEPRRSEREIQEETLELVRTLVRQSEASSAERDYMEGLRRQLEVNSNRLVHADKGTVVSAGERERRTIRKAAALAREEGLRIDPGISIEHAGRELRVTLPNVHSKSEQANEVRNILRTFFGPGIVIEYQFSDSDLMTNN